MTEENYNYRTSQTLLRNQFPGLGKWEIPIIPRFQPQPGDFDDLLLIGFDKTHLEDQNHLDRMVHFFLYDYRFERVWKHPDNDIEKLSCYRAVLSPDFSMYLEMAPVMQPETQGKIFHCRDTVDLMLCLDQFSEERQPGFIEPVCKLTLTSGGSVYCALQF